jgi:hypothetical protein
MNSSLSLHRVALDLLIGARLSLASNPNTFLEDSFPVVVVHHPVLDPTGNRVVLLPRCQLIRSCMVRG